MLKFVNQQRNWQTSFWRQYKHGDTGNSSCRKLTGPGHWLKHWSLAYAHLVGTMRRHMWQTRKLSVCVLQNKPSAGGHVYSLDISVFATAKKWIALSHLRCILMPFVASCLLYKGVKSSEVAPCSVYTNVQLLHASWIVVTTVPPRYFRHHIRQAKVVLSNPVESVNIIAPEVLEMHMDMKFRSKMLQSYVRFIQPARSLNVNSHAC